MFMGFWPGLRLKDLHATLHSRSFRVLGSAVSYPVTIDKNRRGKWSEHFSRC
jgi:hypothetical protein